MAVNATTVWRVRPSGSNTNGGGYDPGISGAGTDYSQQNAPQASGTNGTTTGTTTFTDLIALAFTSAMVGNAIYITGSGQTTGWYFVVGYTSSSIVTLDRSPGTGTGATWNLGGGWADFWTNCTSSGPVVGGNTVYILGSGIPNPGSYTYDYSVNITAAAHLISAGGSTTGGYVTYANDPSTPSYKAPPDTTGGMPCIQLTATTALNFDMLFNGGLQKLIGLWFVWSSTSMALNGVFGGPGGGKPIMAFGCVMDQFGNQMAFGDINAGGPIIIGCEIFSSQSGSIGGTAYAAIYALAGGETFSVVGNNVHNCIGNGLVIFDAFAGGTIVGNIFANNGSHAIETGQTGTAADEAILIMNNTIDGQTSAGGIYVTSGSVQYAFNLAILNNIISNNENGVWLNGGSAAVNSALISFFDYNTFFNNNTDLINLSYGPHDTHGGSNPYVNQATENYTLA